MDSDLISVQFTKPSKNGVNPFKIDNWTSYSFDRDFFVPSDGFSLEITDDRIESIINKINIGDPIELLINENKLCAGFIDTIDLAYASGSGTILRVSGRDKFGVICDATTTPDIKITEKDTFGNAILRVLSNYGFTQENLIAPDDVKKELELFTVGKGGKQGVGSHSKTGRETYKSLKSQVQHLIKPNKNEGYMEYLLRIVKRCGWNIKLCPDGIHVYLGPPTYDRDKPPVYKLRHHTYDIDGNKSAILNENNVISSHMEISWKHQPSTIIGEATTGGFNHRKAIQAVVMLNDIIAYDSNGIVISHHDAMAKELKEKGFMVLDNNPNLIAAIPRVISVNYNDAQKSQRINYIYDDDAHNLSELQFFVRRKMAELNNQFLTLTYKVNGHTNNGDIWKINTMVDIIDETYNLNGKYWIQRVHFYKTRDSGTLTDLTIKLPYVYV